MAESAKAATVALQGNKENGLYCKAEHVSMWVSHSISTKIRWYLLAQVHKHSQYLRKKNIYFLRDMSDGKSSQGKARATKALTSQQKNSVCQMSLFSQFLRGLRYLDYLLFSAGIMKPDSQLLTDMTSSNKNN